MEISAKRALKLFGMVEGDYAQAATFTDSNRHTFSINGGDAFAEEAQVHANFDAREAWATCAPTGEL